MIAQPARVASGLTPAACVTTQRKPPHRIFDTMSVKCVFLLSLALFVAAPAAMTPALAAAAKLADLAPIAQPQIASGALIVDLDNNKVLFSSHPDRVRPIASITKVMTAMVVLDARLPMDEMLSVDISQTPEMRGVFSRVKLNSEISRRNMLLLALMSSENRAAASGASLSRRLRCLYPRHERQSARARHDAPTMWSRPVCRCTTSPVRKIW